MTDRTVLADALESATPEMLRGWAAIAVARDVNDREDLARMGASPSTNVANNAFLGLAALALAVAEMMDGGVSQVSVSADCPTSLSLPDGRVFDGGTLTASLAQLLRGAP